MWNTEGVTSRWDSESAAACANPLELRAYSSRCLGVDPALVLFGGGNTSYKGTFATAQGDVRCLYVKGTGSDLAHVEPPDFTPIDVERVLQLLQGPALDNTAFARALAPLVLDSSAPRPSIETLLHAALPFDYVEHTHADSVLALVNTTHGRDIAREVYGDRALLVPFHHSGFSLAQACHNMFRTQATTDTIGLILEFHGVVAFGNDARSSYENMIELVRMAEAHLRTRGAWNLPTCDVEALNVNEQRALRALRREWTEVAGFPVVLAQDRSKLAMGFARSNNAMALARQAPPTPQHAVFTKAHAMVGRDIRNFSARYSEYVATHRNGFTHDSLPDTAPRICVDPELGIVAASVDAQHAAMTLEMYRHDVEILSRASAHDTYASLPDAAILAAEVHYGGFDRKLRGRAEAGELPLLGVVVTIIGVAGETEPRFADALTALGASMVSAENSEPPGGTDLIIAPFTAIDTVAKLSPMMEGSIFSGAVVFLCGDALDQSPLTFDFQGRCACTSNDAEAVVAAARWLLRPAGLDAATTVLAS